MASLQVRDLPEDLYEALAWRAEREGRSLAQQAVFELRQNSTALAQSRRFEQLARFRAEIAGAVAEPFHLAITPEQMVREDRDR